MEKIQHHRNKIKLKYRLIGTFIIPISLAIVLVPFSILIGWNLITMFLFWFVLIPILALYLPARIFKDKNHLLESLAGLTIFYGIIVLMIYDHYQTDYFQIMLLSGLINVVLVTAISLAIRPRRKKRS